MVNAIILLIIALFMLIHPITRIILLVGVVAWIIFVGIPIFIALVLA